MANSASMIGVVQVRSCEAIDDINREAAGRQARRQSPLLRLLGFARRAETGDQRNQAH